MFDIKIGNGNNLEICLDGETVAIILNANNQVGVAKLFAASQDVLDCLIKSEKVIEADLRRVLETIQDTPEGIERSVENSPLLNEIRSAISKSTT